MFTIKKIIILLISMLVLSGCEDVIINKTPFSKSIDITEEFVWSFPFPKPNATLFEQNVKELHCKGITESKYSEYRVLLDKAGWKFICKISTDDIYMKDNIIINICDQTYVPSNNEIRISCHVGYTGPKRKGAILKPKANKLIQQRINSLDPDDYRSSGIVKYIVELNIGDAYEKMGLQAFVAYSKNNCLGTYLICKGKVLPVPSYDPLDKICVVDIDKDGKYELISCWATLGAYRYGVHAYKFGNPSDIESSEEGIYIAYRNCWIPTELWMLSWVHTNIVHTLAIQETNEFDVNLYTMAVISHEEVEYTNDYGSLKIVDDLLVPTYIDDFPFNEFHYWKYDLTQR